MKRPTFIALGDEKGEVFAVVKPIPENLFSPPKRPVFSAVSGKKFCRFGYCRNCKLPVFDPTCEFCRDECERIYRKEKAKVKNILQRIFENAYTHLLVAALVFAFIYGFFARLK